MVQDMTRGEEIQYAINAAEIVVHEVKTKGSGGVGKGLLQETITDLKDLLIAVVKEVPCLRCKDGKVEEKYWDSQGYASWRMVSCPTCKGSKQAYPEVTGET